MADKLESRGMAEGSDEPSLDIARLQSVVRSFEADADLRWFLREFLTQCSLLPPASIFHHDPITHAYNAGLQAAAMQLLGMLDKVEPAFWPRLQLEHLDAS